MQEQTKPYFARKTNKNAEFINITCRSSHRSFESDPSTSSTIKFFFKSPASQIPLVTYV